MAKDPMEKLLEVVRDESKSDEERMMAAKVWLLLYFAEPIDEKTVRIDSTTQGKVETYLSLLRLRQELPCQ